LSVPTRSSSSSPSENIVYALGPVPAASGTVTRSPSSALSESSSSSPSILRNFEILYYFCILLVKLRVVFVAGKGLRVKLLHPPRHATVVCPVVATEGDQCLQIDHPTPLRKGRSQEQKEVSQACDTKCARGGVGDALSTKQYTSFY
jgi:hypothetical protein